MIIIIHGGAGERKLPVKALKKISESLSSGYKILRNGGSALDSVVESIKVLEDSGLFNSGAGGNLQLDRKRRLDASLMDGKTMKTGSVIGLEGIRNPVQAARIVMESPHVMMTNIGARRIAEENDLEPLPEPEQKSLEKLSRLIKGKNEVGSFYKKHFSTVGAVAVDMEGNIAAGASTGGITAMLPGRVGDTPVIGAGIYAENSLGAVACTGLGEFIIRLSMAKEIVMNMRKLSPLKAAETSLKRMLKLGGDAGVIVINRKGQFTIMHTTQYMASGFADKKGIIVKEGFRRIS